VSSLHLDTRQRVLARFGIARPAPTLDGLRVVYGAWCRNVSFDNLQKRISLVEEHDHLAGGEPDEFFQNLLIHGTGGTCWPTSAALAALLESLGFRVRRLVAAMNYERVGIGPGHASTVAEIDGRDWLVDSSMLTGEPLELRRAERTERNHPVHAIAAEPHDGRWIIRWLRDNSEWMPCMVLEEGVPPERFRTSYESTRGARVPFNTSLIARRNLPDGGLLSLRGGTVTRVDPSGARTVASADDRGRLLVEEFGYSREIVARLPPDEPAATS
jgi:arylamine N-acetyltransferase